MSSPSCTPAVARRGIGPAILSRLRKIAPLVVLAPVLFAASAQAHTVAASATCTSVTFKWTAFSASGNGNGGRNAPEWKIVFNPTNAAAAPKRQPQRAP